MSNDTEFVRKLGIVVNALQAAKAELVREREDDPPILEELLRADLLEPGQQVLGDLQNQVLASLTALDDLLTLQLSSGTLADARRWKIEKIDARTDELIAAGFEYPAASGKRYELTLEAQSRMNALLVIASSALISYPIKWNYIDDSGYYEIVDAADALALCATAIQTIRTILDSGTALKSSVRAAESVEAVMAVEDVR
jgi:hypothetical protein